MEKTYAYLTEEETAALKDSIPDEVILSDVSELFRIFGDKTRVKMLFIMQERGELCVQDIALSMDMSQSAISHQLRILKAAKLVKYRRQGKEVIYSLSDDHIKTIIDQALEHVGE